MSLVLSPEQVRQELLTWEEVKLSDSNNKFWRFIKNTAQYRIHVWKEGQLDACPYKFKILVYHQKYKYQGFSLLEPYEGLEVCRSIISIKNILKEL